MIRAQQGNIDVMPPAGMQLPSMEAIKKKLAGTARERETRARKDPPFGHSLDSPHSDSKKSLQNKVFPAAKTL